MRRVRRLSCVITTESLTKRYANGVTALADLTVESSPAIVGLVGANGAGKSTLIKILLGLLDPTSGRVRVLGLDPEAEAEQIRDRVGYMPEHDCLPPDLAAAEFVTHMARDERPAPHRRPGARLGGAAPRRPVRGAVPADRRLLHRHEAAGKLAQALVHDPDLLLLDEPTNGLDPAGRDAMLALIHRIGTEFGISVVVCSHLLGEVERICDSLIAIDGGRLLRADRISAMTTGSDVLVVEVAEGIDELVGRASHDRASRPAATAECSSSRWSPTTPTTDPAARWPISTCRCTAWISVATAWPSFRRRPAEVANHG